MLDVLTLPAAGLQLQPGSDSPMSNAPAEKSLTPPHPVPVTHTGEDPKEKEDDRTPQEPVVPPPAESL